MEQKVWKLYPKQHDPSI